jgi:cell division protein FtsB
MTGREQERRRRRGESTGGSPTRRTDRIRRPADRFAAAGAAGTDEQDLTDEEYEAGARRAARGRGGLRPPRRSVVSRVAGQVLGRLTTRRTALLALVVCALALSIAVPLHTYLSQRDDLQAQTQAQETLRAQKAKLQQREQQLSDPAQVEAEARTRFHFVLPGETPYVVQLPGNLPPGGKSHTPQKAGSASSWYQTLWNSIVGAHG